MKCVRCLLIAVGILVLGGAVVVISGVVPAKASSGHFPITAWFLEFAMERSVSTQSTGIKPPPLDNAALITRGAAHFEVGCAWCHAQPDVAPGRIVLQMTPHPSNLDEELEKWSAAELFTIVRHGVKFTAMPAWPSATRDDEVWAIVAFLLQYRTLSTDQYRELSGIKETDLALHRLSTDRSIPQVVVQKCVACHGVDGQGRQAFPSLAGQHSTYITTALESYRSGQRPSGTMGPVSERLLDSEIEQIANYFSQLPTRSQRSVFTDQDREAAIELSLRGDAKKRIGACQSCHPVSETSDRSHASKHYPLLSGQRVDYLIGQLNLFRDQVRGGGPQHHIMHNIAQELSDEQIEVLAKLYAAGP